MLVILAVVSLFCNLVSAATVPQYEKVYYAVDNAAYLYKDYLKLHNKQRSVSEFAQRLEIFKENLKKINELNAEFPQTVYGPTVMSDLTDEEIRKMHCLGKSKLNSSGSVTLQLKEDVVYEDHLDWRDKGVVSPVKNQGGCGSCYIFGAIGNIEGQYAIKHQECLSFSVQQTLDCTPNGGCDGGFPHEVMAELAKHKPGLQLESDYPYVGSKGTCHEDGSKKHATVISGRNVTSCDEDTLMKYVTQYGPMAIGLDATDLLIYFGGILHPRFCSKNVEDLNHAVLLIGYGEEKGTKFWIIKNSWGEISGEQGYARIVRGVGACGIGKYLATAEVA